MDGFRTATTLPNLLRMINKNTFPYISVRPFLLNKTLEGTGIISLYMKANTYKVGIIYLSFSFFFRSILGSYSFIPHQKRCYSTVFVPVSKCLQVNEALVFLSPRFLITFAFSLGEEKSIFAGVVSVVARKFSLHINETCCWC